MISAIAIDDEPLPLEIIQSYCAQADFIDLQKTFTSTQSAKAHLAEHPTDLLFLDINMPEVSGIDFYKGIGADTMVIFTTAYSQYAVEGFELSAVDYLLKPYSFERFLLAINKAKDYHAYLQHKTSVNRKDLYIRSEYSLVKVPVTDIQYIEGLADYLKLHLTSGKTLLTRMTMKGIVTKLPENAFARVHRSFIVPLAKIRSVRNKTILLESNTEIPIGVSYEEDFMKVFSGGPQHP